MPLTDGRADIDFQILRQNESKREARGRGKGKEGGRERPSAVAAVCRPGSQRIKIDRLHGTGPMDTEKRVYHGWQVTKKRAGPPDPVFFRSACSSGVS